MVDEKRFMSSEKGERLNEPHIRELTYFVYRLRREINPDVPFFDTFDGGVNAKVLLLLEKPGPMSSNEKGSGFISRDNDDETAKTTKIFLEQAGLQRDKTILWNVIPAWNGTRKIVKEELIQAHSYLEELIKLLPNLQVVVLVGKRASKNVGNYLEKNHKFHIIESFHPSPIVRASNFSKWSSIPEQWKLARNFLTNN